MGNAVRDMGGARTRGENVHLPRSQKPPQVPVAMGQLWADYQEEAILDSCILRRDPHDLTVDSNHPALLFSTRKTNQALEKWEARRCLWLTYTSAR